MLARIAPAGSVASQTCTGNAEGFDSSGALRVGRSGSVAAGARIVIGNELPSATRTGQPAALVIARATGRPSSPSTTNAA